MFRIKAVEPFLVPLEEYTNPCHQRLQVSSSLQPPVSHSPVFNTAKRPPLLKDLKLLLKEMPEEGQYMEADEQRLWQGNKELQEAGCFANTPSALLIMALCKAAQ